MDGSGGDIIDNREVGEEVELLEDHADLAALPGGIVVVQFNQFAMFVFAVADIMTADLNFALVDLLEVVDGAQEGGFPRAGRADNDNDLALFDFEINALEHMQIAIIFMDVGCLYDVFAIFSRICLRVFSHLIYSRVNFVDQFIGPGLYFYPVFWLFWSLYSLCRSSPRF